MEWVAFHMGRRVIVRVSSGGGAHSPSAVVCNHAKQSLVTVDGFTGTCDTGGGSGGPQPSASAVVYGSTRLGNFSV